MQGASADPFETCQTGTISSKSFPYPIDLRLSTLPQKSVASFRGEEVTLAEQGDLKSRLGYHKQCTLALIGPSHKHTEKDSRKSFMIWDYRFTFG